MDLDQLLADSTLEAAVGALAARNAHHLEQMSPQEQMEAAAHWRELAVSVLAAARAALEGGTDQAAGTAADDLPGRAVLVFEDGAGEDEVAIHAAFHPELTDHGPDEVGGTPAQIAALTVLQDLAEGDDAFDDYED